MGESGFQIQLRKLREQHRMSRKVLGECCGLSKNIIGQYERGERSPTLDSVVKIADFFDVSVDFLLGRKKF